VRVSLRARNSEACCHTSVLIAALMKKSIVRELLLNPVFEFFVPEHCIEEIEGHVGEISTRSGLDVESVNLL